MSSLRVNNSIKIWWDHEAQKERLFTLQDCPETHNNYIDLNDDGAQLEKENFQISAICFRLDDLRKQKNNPNPTSIRLLINSHTPPVAAVEKNPFRRPTTISDEFGNNENSRLISNTQRSLSLHRRSMDESHQSPATASNRSYTLSYNDTIYNPSSGLHLNITVPATGTEHLFNNGTPASSSTSGPNPFIPSQNQITPHNITRLDVNASRPLSAGPITNTSFKILSPNELNLRAERMAVSEQIQNGSHIGQNFYGSNPAINPSVNAISPQSTGQIHVSLIKERNGNLELVFKQNERRIDHNEMENWQRQEVRKSLLTRGVWYKMLTHIKAGVPTESTLRLFKELLPPPEAKIFFDEYASSRTSTNDTNANFSASHDNYG